MQRAIKLIFTIMTANWWTIRKTDYLIETSSVLPIQLDYDLKISIVRKAKELPPDC